MTHLAQLIPAEFRREILTTNKIANAVAMQSSEEMLYLMVIWQNFLDPNIKVTCNLCFKRVLDGFKQLEPVLIQLEVESKLIESA